MQAKEFIYSELSEFIKRFPKTRIRYEYDKNAWMHILEVLPSEVYNSDSDYIQWEDEIYKRFVEAFPTECISFISDGALVGIKKPELVVEGAEYECSPITSIFEIEQSFSTKVIQSSSLENTEFTECTIDYKTESFDLPDYYMDSSILKAA